MGHGDMTRFRQYGSLENVHRCLHTPPSKNRHLGRPQLYKEATHRVVAAFDMPHRLPLRASQASSSWRCSCQWSVGLQVLPRRGSNRSDGMHPYSQLQCTVVYLPPFSADVLDSCMAGVVLGIASIGNCPTSQAATTYVHASTVR